MGKGWGRDGERRGGCRGVPLLWIWGVVVLIEKWNWWVGGWEPEVLRGAILWYWWYWRDRFCGRHFSGLNGSRGIFTL